MIDDVRLLLDWLRVEFATPVRVVSDKPADFTQLIWVGRSGGPASQFIDFPRESIECFDVTKHGARGLAVDVCNALMTRFRGHSVGGGTVTAVSVGSGPFELPWENPSVHRFGIAAQLTIR